MGYKNKCCVTCVGVSKNGHVLIQTYGVNKDGLAIESGLG